MARRPTPDPTIGERIRTRRQLRGWSIRHAADRAGIAHTTWSRIERGLLSADNRFTVADIATALECSVTDLTGHPALTADDTSAAAQATVTGVRQALAEIDLDDPPMVNPRPLQQLAADTALVGDLRHRCDYAGAGRMLPDLLRELHAATHGPHRAEALRLLVAATFAAGGTVRYVGGPAEYWVAAERCWQAGHATEDPVLIGLGSYERAHAATACGAYGRAWALARQAAEDLETRADCEAKFVMLGQLHLTAAFAALGDHRSGDAPDLMSEAERLAERTGDTDTLRLMFGPTNVRFWRVSMDTDAGDPGQAVATARETVPTRVASASRQVAFYMDYARALTRVRRDKEAVRTLVHAERLAAVRVHSSPLMRETVRCLLDRAQRRAGGTELRALCERMGVTT